MARLLLCSLIPEQDNNAIWVNLFEYVYEQKAEEARNRYWSDWGETTIQMVINTRESKMALW